MKAMLLVFAVIGLVLGCSGTREAYKAARGLDEEARVMAHQYDLCLVQLQGAKDSGELAGIALEHAQAVVRNATPMIGELRTASTAYAAIATAKTEADLRIAISNAAVEVSHLLDLLAGRPVSMLYHLPLLVPA